MPGWRVIDGRRSDLDFALICFISHRRVGRDGLNHRIAGEDRLDLLHRERLRKFIRLLLVTHFLRGKRWRGGNSYGDQRGPGCETLADRHSHFPFSQWQ